ncbi:MULTISPECIES: Rv3654c family TadE-like protein [unclassified Candidatus Sulfotelmatobacter]|uniref:Rv3654c family TadE-like protein n=1 Tax=unclassified Candidatus Sulfotelmatobacter TaxID=2635724 RepID=UPI001CC26CAE|nr:MULTISPECIES: Rv3654c family TadE-like protein [unclassified Candidatus Sulfotelmatobacter]
MRATNRRSAAPNPPRSVLGGPAEHGHPDEGSGTVHGMSIAVLMCAMLIVILLLGQAGISMHRAAKAADLAALAAADTARGLASGVPCDVARAVAAENGAVMDHCELVTREQTTVDVRTSIALFGPLEPLGPAVGMSRAGPPPGQP